MEKNKNHNKIIQSKLAQEKCHGCKTPWIHWTKDAYGNKIYINIYPSNTNIKNNKPSDEEIKKSIKKKKLRNNKAFSDIEAKLLKIIYLLPKFLKFRSLDSEMHPQ